MKNCIKCNTRKKEEQFHKDSRRPDGLFPYCKKCRQIPRKPAKCRPIKEVLSNYRVAENECWEWSGTLDIDGYGVACFKGERQKAHRLSFSHHVEPIKQGLIICHKCDNPSCINPNHLYQGTSQDNTNDMIARKRQNPPIGERSGNAVLEIEQVRAIKHDPRRHNKIAMDYGIAASTVSSIKTGRNWSRALGEADRNAKAI